jgi:AraC-like DNA-binding protein
MQDNFININFDRTKRPAIDFDIIPLENIPRRGDLNHDPQKLHRVHFYVLLLITSGSGKHNIDFREYEYAKGSVLTIRKNQIHSFGNGDAKGFIILFTEEYVLSYLEKASTDKIPELFNELLFNQHTLLKSHELEDTLTLIHQIQAELNQPLDDYTSGIIRNLLQVLVSRIYRVRKASASLTLDHKYIPQFLNFQKLVELHCQEVRSVQHYADQLNVTTRTLNNFTHKIVNKSAKKLIDEINILKIKRLLINTPLSIKEIAYNSGFDEPSNLIKFFKRYTGQTPENFRGSYIAHS